MEIRESGKKNTKSSLRKEQALIKKQETEQKDKDKSIQNADKISINKKT